MLVSQNSGFLVIGKVKTTLDLPDDLMRTIKLRAVREDKKLKDLIAELLGHGLKATEQAPARRQRVRLPLIECGHSAAPGEEMTPERVAQLLLDEEVQLRRR